MAKQITSGNATAEIGIILGFDVEQGSGTPCEVLEQIGFSDTEIPTGDALRQMLSYHSIPKVVKSLERQRKLADKREPSKDE